MANKDKTIEVTRPSVVEKKVKQKWLMVAVGGGLLLLIVVMASQPDRKPIVQQRGVQQKSITLGDFSETDWVARAQAEVRSANEKSAQIRAENEQLKATMSGQGATLQEVTNTLARIQQELEDQRRARSETEAQLRSLSEKTESLPKSQPRDSLAELGDEEFTPPPVPRDARYEAAMEGLTVGGEPAGTGDGRPSAVSKASKEAIIVAADPNSSGDRAAARVTYRPNAYSGFLPGGSFAEAVMLYGVDAGTSDMTRTNPMPVMMRIGTDAITPGDSKYKLSACAAIGEAYGDLSSERAYIRVNRISCLDAKRKVVLETTVTGVAVDADGSLGLRGEVIRRNGQVIGKAMIAGVAEGLAQIGRAASEASARTITAPVAGGAAGTQQIQTNLDPATLAQAGGFGGVSNAASQISQLYLREAASIFPVIAVPQGRKVTISFTKGSQLKWEEFEGAYKKNVVPDAR